VPKQTTPLEPTLARQALDLAPVMVRDLDGTIRLWTEGMVRLYGYAPDEAFGRVSHDLLKTEFPRPLGEIEAELRETGQWAGELVHRRRDAERIFTASLWSLARDPAGAPHAVTEVNHDITREKRSEAARRYLAAIVESSEDAIVGKDLDGIVTSWNPGAEAMFGYSAAEMIGQPITRLFPPERLIEEVLILERLRRGEALEHFETVRRHKDGRELDVWVTASPIYDAAGAVIGISKIARDITEKKRVETQRDAVRAELLHVSRLGMMGQMATSLAHELNQPLAALTSYMGALQRLAHGAAPDPQRIQTIAEKASEQTRRAGEIVRRLRQFVSKGDTDRQRADLNQVVREALALGLVGVQQHGVTTRLQLADGMPPVLIDRIQIQQVLLNLVRNAIEAMAHGARRELVIETSRADDTAVIRVADTGPGIAPDIMARLFEPFTTSKPTGMGVGLSICREIVEAHGGRIAAAPNPPAGTVFVVTLPIAEPDDGAIASDA